MQEEVENRTINLAVSTAKLTGRALKAGIEKFLRNKKEKKLEKKRQDPFTHGKQSVKQLIGQGQGCSTIEVSNQSVRDFCRIAAKYNVDYAITKDKTVSPAKYVVFFKAKDTDALTQVVSAYAAKVVKKEQRSSVIEKLHKFQKIAAKVPKKIKEKIQVRSR